MALQQPPVTQPPQQFPYSTMFDSSSELQNLSSGQVPAPQNGVRRQSSHGSQGSAAQAPPNPTAAPASSRRNFNVHDMFDESVWRVLFVNWINKMFLATIQEIESTISEGPSLAASDACPGAPQNIEVVTLYNMTEQREQAKKQFQSEIIYQLALERKNKNYNELKQWDQLRSVRLTLHRKTI